MFIAVQINYFIIIGASGYNGLMQGERMNNYKNSLVNKINKTRPLDDLQLKI